MAAASMKDLFAEDSSEDDDESVGQKEPEQLKEADTNAAATTTTTSDDDKMDTTTTAEEDKDKSTDEANRKPQILQDEDDDSDDEKDEATFDDADADIRGESAPEPPPAETMAVTRTDADTTDTEKKKKRERLIMKVLENERPPAGVTMHMTKLPSMLVGIQPEAFDEDTYSAAMEEKEYNDVHNMIRWRYKRNSIGELERDANNKLVRESNARIVQWDNGSYTLHVGSEVFEVDSLKTATPNGFAGINGYVYQSQKATYENEQTKETTSGGTVLECMGLVQSKLTARPSSLQSEAHKNLTVAVRQRNMKKARIAEYVTQEDPEKLKAERIKVKQELDKASARKQKSYRSRRTPGMNRRYMEEEEDDGRYDSVNIGALKRRREEEEYDYGQDSEEDEDDEWERQRMASARKRRAARAGAAASQKQDESEQEDFAMGDDSSDDEDEQINRVRASAKRRSKDMFDDDD